LIETGNVLPSESFPTVNTRFADLNFWWG